MAAGHVVKMLLLCCQVLTLVHLTAVFEMRALIAVC